MSAIGPYSKAFDNTHMWNFSDLRGPKSSLCINTNSAFGYISKHPEMKKFSAIIEKAGMIGPMNEPEFNSTVFVPLDRYLKDPLHVYKNLDKGAARNILNVSMLNNKIDGMLIRSSPVSSYTTKDPYNPDYMYVTNISGVTEINNCAHVIQYDIKLDNAIIHVTDNIITPNYEHFIY